MSSPTEHVTRIRRISKAQWVVIAGCAVAALILVVNELRHRHEIGLRALESQIERRLNRLDSSAKNLERRLQHLEDKYLPYYEANSVTIEHRLNRLESEVRERKESEKRNGEEQLEER